MARICTLLTGIAAGAATMYFYDPDRGRRRRALIKDQLNHAAYRSQSFFRVAARDARNRSAGLASQARSLFHPDEAADAVLTERVRAKLGRVVSHPHALKVTAQNGRVTLAGPILESEADAALACARGVRGVSEVEDRLERHDSAEHISALQGGIERRGRAFEFAQENWSPTARLIAGAAGAGLALYSFARRGPLGALAKVAGLGLLARSATNLEVKRLVGVGAGPRAVDIEKTMHINAPVEDVFHFWTRPDNFPRFMRHVREVTGSFDGVTHWVVDGAAGGTVEWDAQCTRYIPNQLIEWRTQPGSAVEHEGCVRFDPSPRGGSRVHIQMSYNPPAGAIGHALAVALGVDPKSQLDDDLMRVKTLIETGHPARDAARPANPGSADVYPRWRSS